MLHDLLLAPAPERCPYKSATPKLLTYIRRLELLDFLVEDS